MPRDGGSSSRFDAVLAVVCDRLGIAGSSARLVHLHSNAVFTFPTADLAVRIAGSLEGFTGIARSLAVTSRLAGDGFSCAVPAAVEEQPFAIAGNVASVWRYVPVAAGPSPSARDLPSC